MCQEGKKYRSAIWLCSEGIVLANPIQNGRFYIPIAAVLSLPEAGKIFEYHKLML
jgi:hypothetical protein